MSEEKEPDPTDGIEGIEMLSEPLLTEEGFVNAACMQELEAAIRKMPETYERLAHNPEWSTPAWCLDTEIIGALAGCAVRAFRGYPPKLDEVIGFTHACLLRGEFADQPDCGGFRMAKLSLCDINRILWSFLEGLAPFDDWNKEEVVGKRWLDLSALLHQVCIQIRNDRRYMRAFNIKFEEKHGASS